MPRFGKMARAVAESWRVQASHASMGLEFWWRIRQELREVPRKTRGLVRAVLLGDAAGVRAELSRGADPNWSAEGWRRGRIGG